MNDEASCNHGEFRTSEAFQRQYATIVLQLKDVNKQVGTVFPFLIATVIFSTFLVQNEYLLKC